ncbi:hypothetical protein ACFSFZ_20065 [Mixta tenebrionis]|uniref:Uncharacterized protein n=1 Tax=Mixta tenebrionis TaxID=2562439 RepID=A0A506VDR6_9GAMM|nr:hypothetical protein [Mixta tenebrionis]TPW43559.1 hypothetical protein FKM52_03155 [Mixta tenebrionis]
MNSAKIEKDLARNGFTGKDIAAMRQYLGQDGATYPTLLNELRRRFIFSIIISFILVCATIHQVYSGDINYLFAYSLTWIIIGPIIYFMTPMKLGFKAFRYKLKN